MKPSTKEEALKIALIAVKEWLDPDYGCNFVEHCVGISLLDLDRAISTQRTALLALAADCRQNGHQGIANRIEEITGT